MPPPLEEGCGWSHVPWAAHTWRRCLLHRGCELAVLSLRELSYFILCEIPVGTGVFLAIPRKINIAGPLPQIGWGSNILCLSASFSHGVPRAPAQHRHQGRPEGTQTAKGGGELYLEHHHPKGTFCAVSDAPDFAALFHKLLPLVGAHFPALCVTSPSRLQRSHISPVRTLRLGEPVAWLLGRRLTGRTHEWLARCGSCQEGKGPRVSPLKCCRLHSCQSLHGKQHDYGEMTGIGRF